LNKLFSLYDYLFINLKYSQMKLIILVVLCLTMMSSVTFLNKYYANLNNDYANLNKDQIDTFDRCKRSYRDDCIDHEDLVNYNCSGFAIFLQCITPESGISVFDWASKYHGHFKNMVENEYENCTWTDGLIYQIERCYTEFQNCGIYKNTYDYLTYLNSCSINLESCLTKNIMPSRIKFDKLPEWYGDYIFLFLKYKETIINFIVFMIVFCFLSCFSGFFKNKTD
jgi:hypothetical protein